MAKRTKGPWLVAEHDGTTVYSGSNHTGVAACAPDPLPPPHTAGGNHFAPPDDIDERKANARAIAAVPDLIDALRPFANVACDEPCECPNCRARAAIEKAEGV